jgi:signal recognition particle GTPase
VRNGIIIAMTTINGKKKLEKKKEKKKINENLFFHLEEELIESDEDIQRLKEILENENRMRILMTVQKLISKKPVNSTKSLNKTIFLFH